MTLAEMAEIDIEFLIKLVIKLFYGTKLARITRRGRSQEMHGLKFKKFEEIEINQYCKYTATQ